MSSFLRRFSAKSSRAAGMHRCWWSYYLLCFSTKQANVSLYLYALSVPVCLSVFTETSMLHTDASFARCAKHWDAVCYKQNTGDILHSPCWGVQPLPGIQSKLHSAWGMLFLCGFDWNREHAINFCLPVQKIHTLSVLPGVMDCSGVCRVDPISTCVAKLPLEIDFIGALDLLLLVGSWMSPKTVSETIVACFSIN